MEEVVWSREQVKLLINLYKDRPLLWSHSDPLFKDKSEKQRAWQEIALSMNMNKLEVQTKIRILMIQFKRESKKLKSGVAGDYCGKSKWFAFDSLLFLKDRGVGTPHHLREAPAPGKTVEDNDSVPEEPLLDQGLLDVDVRPVQGTKRVCTTTEVMSPTKRVTMCPPSSLRPTLERPPGERWYNPVAEEAFSVMKSLGSNIKPKDEFDIFGELVACQLRKCSDLRERAIAKQRINQVLFDLEMCNWNDPLSHSTSPSTSRCSDNNTWMGDSGTN